MPEAVARSRPVRELLVVELLGGIGDTLLALPSVHALARAHPGAAVRVLTYDAGAELLDRDPHVTEVVAVPSDADPAAAVLAQLRRVPPDVAVTTTTHSGIADLLTKHVAHAMTDLWQGPPPHALVDRRFLRLLAAAGLIHRADVDLPLRVHLAAAEEAAGRGDVPEGAPLVLVPGSGMAVKRWAVARWAAVAAAYPGPVLSVGEPVTGARLLPPVTLRQLAAQLAAAGAAGGVAVGVDTGPLRLATAVGCPAVGLFGPSAAGRYGLSSARSLSLQGLPGCDVRVPADFTTQDCWWEARCPLSGADPACMADLSVADVLSALRDLRGDRAA